MYPNSTQTIQNTPEHLGHAEQMASVIANFNPALRVEMLSVINSKLVEITEMEIKSLHNDSAALSDQVDARKRFIQFVNESKSYGGQAVAKNSY